MRTILFLAATAVLPTSSALAQECLSDADCTSDEACGPLQVSWGYVNGIYTQIFVPGTCYDRYPECWNDEDCFEGQACGPLQLEIPTDPDSRVSYGPGDCYDVSAFGGSCAYDSDCASGLDCEDRRCVQDWDHCATDSCGLGMGHCTADQDCDRGLTCTPNVGGAFGLDPAASVCLGL